MKIIAHSQDGRPKHHAPDASEQGCHWLIDRPMSILVCAALSDVCQFYYKTYSCLHKNVWV